VPFANDDNRVRIWPQCCRLFAASPPGGLNSPKMQIPIGEIVL
jgi:hypothetical protein